MSYTVKDFAKEFGYMPGIEEFIEMLNTPDDMFDMLYPTLRESFLASFNDPGFQELQSTLKTTAGYEKVLTDMPIAVQKLQDGNSLSKNKMQFIRMLSDFLVCDPYDAEILVELGEGAQLPTYAHLTDAGADIYAKEDIIISAGARGQILKTGLKMVIPIKWQLAIRPRSGLSHKTTMRISNAPGTIDSDYRDEVGVIVDNLSDSEIIFKKGERIAQFVLERVYRAKYTAVESIANMGNDRGGGYGSSGK